MPDNINQPTIGLNTESVQTQINPGQLTYALNAMIEGFDGQSITYQNEQANTECVVFPDGYRVIGVKNVTSIDTVYYWLSDPITGHSMIGYSTLNSCIFNTLLDDRILGSDLMNFNINNPIFKIEVKTTNCSTQLYWTDKLNPRRYIDLNNLPWKESAISGVFVPEPGLINADKMLIQPNFSVPKLECTAVNIGGLLVEGDYQFAIQYADVLSNGYTSYYSVTNEVRIFLDHKMSVNFNEETSKSITVNISDLDTTGLYEYFNLAVIKTINAITSVELVGTYYITGNTHELTYTGEEHSGANIKLTINDILEQNDYYDLAGDLTQVDNVLVWADLIKEDDISFQKIWNQVPVKWETWRIPYNEAEGYTSGINCANIQGYMRDEVYPLEGCFILANGKQTTRGHIPGRIANPSDLVLATNPEASIGASEDPCNPSLTPIPAWKVYNTGSVDSFVGIVGDSCYKGVWERGTMSYWESTELYPNNPSVWGSLANQPIRHHKFPDSSITHIHDQNPSAIGTDAYNTFEHAIFPIGINIDINALWYAIQSSTDLTQVQKNQIVGFKIMRGDIINNKAIVAKGMFYNVGEYTKNASTYYYPNYPLNDLNPDPFISKVPVDDRTGDHISDRLDIFHNDRFTFHSPDTSFFRPTGIQGSFVKIETAEYGNCKGHFVPVLNNAGQKLRTVKDLEIALAGAVASIVGIEGDFHTTVGTAAGVTVGVSPSFHAENFFPAFNNVLDIIDKLIPYVNYGWQYNCVGFYGNYSAANPIGNRIRAINYGGYINPGLQGTFGDTFPINNTFRESSVYVSLSGGFAPTQSIGVPADDSRVIASQLNLCGQSTPFYRNTSSYYGSIKRYLPGQWGEIFSYKPIDTAFYSTFFDTNGVAITNTDTIFGGDIFINRFALKRKHSFFLKSSVGRPDGTDIDYNQDTTSNTNTGNVGYPIWYYSTSNIPLNVSNGALNGAVVNFTNTLNNWILNLLTAGIATLVMAMILLVTLITDGILTHLGIKLTNLECSDFSGLHETGQSYLYAYGIPFYFVESEVNVDMRQSTNIREGNFYPQVSSDIPDDWLQETNVPIAYDNIYTYNKTYSKENKETYFATLRLDWTPNNPCFTNFNNRAIWSDKSSLEETKNNWLIYRPANTFDFPKGFGKLQNIDNLSNNQILTRFENKTQIYNALTTLNISTGPAAYVGNTQMFSTLPIDLSHTDIGNVGTQNSILLKTDFGTVYTDAKRGEVVLLEGTKVDNLESRGMAKWFYQNLPFQILNYFPNVNTDNNFNGIGLTGAYDAYYSRIILTKKDYIPLDPTMIFDGINFSVTTTFTSNVNTTKTCCPTGYTYDSETHQCRLIDNIEINTPPIWCTEEVTNTTTTVVQLEDPRYFCDKSWTISYSFTTNSWISWHSYIPDYYISFYSHFQSGKNSIGSIWDHDYKITNFNQYYGVEKPYVLEYPHAYKEQDEILQNIKDFTTARKYIDYLTFYEPEEILYFNKSIIYNGQQCTGVLNLVPKVSNNLSSYMSYPIFNSASKDIQLVKSDNFFNYNTFWDIVISKSQPIWITGCDMNETDKDLNQSNMNYANNSYKKPQLRAKDCKIRHILDNRNDVRLISKFLLAPTVISYK